MEMIWKSRSLGSCEADLQNVVTNIALILASRAEGPSGLQNVIRSASIPIPLTKKKLEVIRGLHLGETLARSTFVATKFQKITL